MRPDDNVKNKLDENYLIDSCKHHIAELVNNDSKQFETLCYNIYNGRRNDREYQHLVDNYGIAHPMKIPFIPLMGRIVKSLVNNQLNNKLDYLITCQNKEGLNLKLEQKRLMMLDEVKEAIEGENSKEWKEKLTKELGKKYSGNWQADFEITAQDYMEYYIQSHNLKQLFNLNLQDLCVVGGQYRRTYIRELNKDPITKLINPEHIYKDYHGDKLWLNEQHRVVYREFLSVSDIILQYGSLIEEKELELLRKHNIGDSISSYNEVLAHDLYEGNNYTDTVYNMSLERKRDNLISVLHVEWIATDKMKAPIDDLKLTEPNPVKSENRFIQNLYEGYKIEIGDGIYFGYGRVKYPPRTLQNPYATTLTYDGCLYKGRNNPQKSSLIFDTKSIQDLYDITHFQLNNLFHSARPGGTYIVAEHLNQDLGDSMVERLNKTAGYMKNGMPLVISLSQEGNEATPFNNYGSYPSNLEGQMLQSFMAYLEILETQALNTVGLTRQSMGNMEERDGKTVSTMAIQQGEINNKDLYFLNGELIKRTLASVINMARISYKEDTVFSYLIPDTINHKIFTFESEKMSLCDFNIFVSDSQNDNKKLLMGDELVKVALQQSSLDLPSAYKVLMSNSITKRSLTLTQAFDKQEEQAINQLQEAQKQLEQLNAKLKEQEQIIQSLGGLQEKNLTEDLKLRREQMMINQRFEDEKLSYLKEKGQAEQSIEVKKLEAEIAQTIDASPYNDKINFNR
jgi:hypothetical protein